MTDLTPREIVSELDRYIVGQNDAKRALENLPLNSNGFDLEAEIAGLARKKGLRHSEIPVDWSQRKGGNSKLSSISDGFIILFRILLT